MRPSYFHACVLITSWVLLGGCQTLHKQNSLELDRFIRAAANGDLPTVSSAVLRGVNVNVQDASGATAIQKAARYNRHLVVEYLIKNGADYRVADYNGFDALLQACAYGQDAAVRALLLGGADPNAVTDKGLFPLLAAAAGDYALTVRLLVQKGARPNLANTNGTTALLLACEKNSRAAVAALLDVGADPNLPDSEGWTPLLVATQLGYGPLLEELVRHGVDVDRMNRQGMSPLLLAIECDQLEMARFLVKSKAKWTTGGQYPYVAGVSCYLWAVLGNGTLTGVELAALYASAARLFELAAADFEAANTEKNNEITGRNLRSTLFIGSSVLLIAIVGEGPIPCALTNERLHDSIKQNKIRLDRCKQLKAQCDDAIARLGKLDALNRPETFILEDLTETFAKK